MVVNVYKRADGKKNEKLSDEDIIKNSHFDYNPATKAKYITTADADKVRSKNSRVQYALSDTEEKIQARL